MVLQREIRSAIHELRVDVPYLGQERAVLQRREQVVGILMRRAVASESVRTDAQRDDVPDQARDVTRIQLGHRRHDAHSDTVLLQ